MSKEIFRKYCNDCEDELTERNTAGYGGFDEGNFSAALAIGGTAYPGDFTKCDSCFDGDIDRHLEKLYE